MFVITQGRYSDTRVIGVVKEESEIPKGVLEQKDILVFEAPVLPYVPSGYKPYEVFIDRKGDAHDAYETNIYMYATVEDWTNEHTLYRHVLAETGEKAIKQILDEIHRAHA